MNYNNAYFFFTQQTTFEILRLRYRSTQNDNNHKMTMCLSFRENMEYPQNNFFVGYKEKTQILHKQQFCLLSRATILVMLSYFILSSRA